LIAGANLVLCFADVVHYCRGCCTWQSCSGSSLFWYHSVYSFENKNL